MCVITIACNSSCDKIPVAIWGHVMKDTVREKKNIVEI